jgi:hypothetical protein
MVKINLTPLKTINPKNDYDIIISSSLFMMKESYRNFPIYVRDFLAWLPLIPRKTYVRLYVDTSVLDNPEFHKIIDLNFPHLEIVQFECPEFFHDGFHDGTFGSIVRLIPLYEKPNKVNYIWISDVDMPTKFFNYNNIKLMLKNNAKVFYYSKSCYNKPWDEGIRHPIGAGRIIMSSKVILNKGNFTRFLNDVLKGKYHHVLEQIKSKYNEEDSYRKFQNIKYFPYGFDELFTNMYLYPVFQRLKRIIAFEIGLSSFLQEKIVEIPGKKKKYSTAYYKSWAVKMKQDEYKFLLDTTEEIYEKIKDLDLEQIDPKNATILNICKKDYEEYRKYISPVSNEGGVSALLVKKPNEE